VVAECDMDGGKLRYGAVLQVTFAVNYC